MGLEISSIPVMSTEAERIFSGKSNLYPPLGASLMVISQEPLYNQRPESCAW